MEKNELLSVLKERFEAHAERHSGLSWHDAAAKIEANEALFHALQRMEETGGEPDVMLFPDGEWYFTDFSRETPKGRTSLCYDNEARLSRAKDSPVSSACEMAEEIGGTILNEEEYLALQKFGPFDTKSSSWILTPDVTRVQGGALFGEQRYKRVFFFHNGVQSYYAARGFRVKVKLD